MECRNNNKEENGEREGLELSNKKKKYKIMKNKEKNYIFNLISYFINNRNDFEVKLKPSDIEIILETNSDISTFSKLKYKTKLNYGLFNSKRDTIKNIKLYKQFPVQFEIQDEYYKNVFDDVIVDIFPQIKKGIKLEINEFPFFSYDNNKILKKINKDEFKNNLQCKENEYILCIYIINYKNESKKENIFEIIENVISSDMFVNYFKSVFIIFQIESKDLLDEYIMQNINKFLDNKNDKYKNKLFFLYNFLSSYKNSKSNENCLINIFEENKSFMPGNESNYFFILDNNETIIEIAPFFSIGKTITLFLLELQKHKNNNEKISFISKRQKEENVQFKSVKKIIDFILGLKKLNLDYIFDLSFRISISLYPNDELTKIKLRKINCLKIRSHFRKKENLFLRSCSEIINIPNCEFLLNEIPTVDIDIDFDNMKCEKCKKIIPDESFLYYCYICKVKYCYECVQSQLKNNKGKQKYIDAKHNLIFFKTRNKNQFLNIDKLKLGNNLFVECNEEDLSYWSSTRCNGCRESLRRDVERYICLDCKRGIKLESGYIDFCSKCIDIMCKNKKEMENLEKKADGLVDHYDNSYFDDYKFKIEHRHEKHIYLLLPLQSERGVERGYYIF